MNSLSRIGLVPTAVSNNIMTVMAGEVGGNMSLVFAGGIKYCWPDFTTSTEGILRVSMLRLACSRRCNLSLRRAIQARPMSQP